MNVNEFGEICTTQCGFCGFSLDMIPLIENFDWSVPQKVMYEYESYSMKRNLLMEMESLSYMDFLSNDEEKIIKNDLDQLYKLMNRVADLRILVGSDSTRDQLNQIEELIDGVYFKQSNRLMSNFPQLIQEYNLMR